MAYNLFIAYDLDGPDRDYEAIEKAIMSLGRWHRFQGSLFYVSTTKTLAETFRTVHSVMDSGDSLVVIDAIGGMCTTEDKPPIDAINAVWFGLA